MNPKAEIATVVLETAAESRSAIAEVARNAWVKRTDVGPLRAPDPLLKAQELGLHNFRPETGSLIEDIPRMKAEELIVASPKTINSKSVLVEEGNKRLQTLDLSQPIPSHDRLLENDEVEDLLKRTESLSRDRSLSLSDKGELSAAGVHLYRSSRQLDDFARIIEDVTKDGKYSTLVADDLSGRLPAIYAHDRLQRLADLRGTTPPRLVFMASGNRGKADLKDLSDIQDPFFRSGHMIQRIEAEEQELKRGTALVLTEIISSGNSIKQFSGAFRPLGIKFDVASMDSYVDHFELRNITGVNDLQLFEGSGPEYLYLDGAGSKYSLRKAVGVEKFGIEPTSRPTLEDPQSSRSLRDELYALGRYHFEKSH